MTTDNLSFIRNNYPDQKFHFIRINMKEYVDTVSKTLFSQNELVEILTWDINDDLKISLLKMSKEPISIIGKGYSTAVCLHILSNNFSESDLPGLFSSFEQWDDSIQEKIFDYAISNISSIRSLHRALNSLYLSPVLFHVCTFCLYWQNRTVLARQAH